MSDRYRSIVDVHLVLVQGGLVLLTRRANTGYADGLLHLVSGHLEDGEDVVSGVIREAAEEIGIQVAREDLECVHVMHHRNPEGQARVGFFFRTSGWSGEPVNAEPEKCSELVWSPLDAMPADMVAYPAEALRRVGKGETFSVHGWAGSDTTSALRQAG
jgi:ADP-ribose pyrophosphatase YjhB (NUDIX family)